MVRDASGRAVRDGWLVLIAAAAVYANTLANGFALDDLLLVRDNPVVAAPDGVRRAFASPYWMTGEEAGLYRPVATASLALGRMIHGPGPAGHHLINLLLHALASWLVWRLATGSRLGRAGALAAGLLFAVHPLHTEAVANVAGRAELLAALGVLGAWLAHRRAAAEPRWLLPAAAVYLVALWSKESALVAPLLFLLDDRLRRPSARVGTGLAVSAYAGAALVGLASRIAVLGGIGAAGNVVYLDNPAAFSTAGVRWLTAAWVQARYLALVVWPHPLSSDYSFRVIESVLSPADPRALAGLAVLVAAAAAFAVGLRRSPVVALGIAVWAVALLPASNFLFPVGTIMAERLTYLPSAGACLIAGLAVDRLASRLVSATARRAGAAAGLGALVVLAALSIARNPAWRDNATLALRDVATHPQSAKLQAGAAIALHDRGDLAGAEAAFNRAVALWPDYAQMHYNLAELLAARGAFDEALSHFLRAASLSPANPRPREGIERLARRLEGAGRTEEAARARAALEQTLNPRRAADR